MKYEYLKSRYKSKECPKCKKIFTLDLIRKGVGAWGQYQCPNPECNNTFRGQEIKDLLSILNLADNLEHFSTDDIFEILPKSVLWCKGEEGIEEDPDIFFDFTIGSCDSGYTGIGYMGQNHDGDTVWHGKTVQCDHTGEYDYEEDFFDLEGKTLRMALIQVLLWCIEKGFLPDKQKSLLEDIRIERSINQITFKRLIHKGRK